MSKMDLHSEEFLHMIMRRQLGLSMSIASVFVAIIVAVPLLNKFAPDAMNTPFLGFTLSWFILGFAIFPVLIVLAIVFVRHSNAFEDEAIGMVDASTLPTGSDHRDSASTPTPAH